MDIVVLLNIINFLLLFYTIIKRYRKNKVLQLNDFVLFFFMMFFPIGIIRAYLGYESNIQYDIFYDRDLLEVSSWVVLVFIVVYLLGCRMADVVFRNIKPLPYEERPVTKYYLSTFDKITYFFAGITLLAMIMFLRSQESLEYYFANIDAIRQTLSGQMGYYTLIYVNSLVALYNILLHKKFRLSSKLGILISILFFVVYGFRGNVISIAIITFFVLQKLDIFKLKFSLRNILIGFFTLYLFVLSQDLRSVVDDEPMYSKLLKRFNGIESVMVVQDKVIERYMYTPQTFINNIRFFLEVPIPRSMYKDKIKPVSILFTDALFYDIGKRHFSTGGISPTIIGSLLWNFHYLGILGMVAFSMAVIYVEKKIKQAKNSFKILVLTSLSLYLILAVEYPENFLAVLWQLAIGLVIIYFMDNMLIKRKYANGSLTK